MSESYQELAGVWVQLGNDSTCWPLHATTLARRVVSKQALQPVPREAEPAQCTLVEVWLASNTPAILKNRELPLLAIANGNTNNQSIDI